MLSCIQHHDTTNEIGVFDQQEKIELKYAEGFDLTYQDTYIQFVVHSIGNNEFFADTFALLTNNSGSDIAVGKILQPNITSIATMSSTHLAYLEVLQSLDKIKALCGTEYVINTRVKEVLTNNEVQELCLGENVVLENLLKVSPDLFFTYPFGSDGNERYEANGITTMHIAEYLEKSQLARLEWIKLFGLILEVTEQANDYFNQVEQSYISLKQNETDTNMRFILNLPFQDQWYMPSSNSLTVQLIEDAGLAYFYSEKSTTENVLHSKEEVWSDAAIADYWVIIASRPKGFTLDDLIKEEPVYNKFKSVKNHQVIFCNTAQVDYFGQGVVEPHIMLQDLLFAVHKIDQHQPKYFFLLN